MTQKGHLKVIMQAVEELFGDTSVPAITTLNTLEEVRDEIDMKIGTIKTDIRRNENR